MDKEYCQQDCCYLSLTEKRQNELKNLTGMTSHHFCKKYNVRLYHMLAHPNLYKCYNCYMEGINKNTDEVNEDEKRRIHTKE